MSPVSKALIFIGVILILSGLIWHFTGGKIPFGKLPGDFRYETENTKIYVPITTSIILSILLSMVAYFLRK